MSRPSRQNPRIREFILRNIPKYPRDIAAQTMAKFGVSRAAVGGYMKRLLAEGLVEAEGNTRGRNYKLRPLSKEIFEIQLWAGLPEHHIFRFRILPLMKNVPQNVIDICQYGFTEMLNNAIDHSGSTTALISYSQTYTTIEMVVLDRGVGIFEKIQKDFSLADPRSALLELSKGKLTSDKARHSGEGIFFTSRMFDEFNLSSGHLFYSRERQEDDEWLIETRDVKQFMQGTTVQMTISTSAKWTTGQVFEHYTGDNVSFRKAHVPVSLGRYPNEQLVSRSQAKRILARFDQFSEVILDFHGVQEIGQPFADEIFRVFSLAHPEVAVIPLGANASIRRMIDYVRRPETTENEKGQLSLLAGLKNQN